MRVERKLGSVAAILAFALSPTMASAARAQQAQPVSQQSPAPSVAGIPPELSRLLATPEHRYALLRAARSVAGPNAQGCQTANYATTGEVGILEPLRTGAQGRLTAGAWKESITQSGCGPDRLLNTITAVRSDGSLDTQPLLPGTTITDPQLQRDSVGYAAGGMGAMPPGCDQGAVTDTRFVGVDGDAPGVLPQPSAPPRPWTEVWTLQACAKHVDVTMHFAPDPTGTNIRADPANP